MKENLHIYELVRANLIACVKDVYFEDPRFVVRRIDSYYSNNHDLETELFLKGMTEVFNEIVSDFAYHVPEYQRITKKILELEQFIQLKLQEA